MGVAVTDTKLRCLRCQRTRAEHDACLDCGKPRKEHEGRWCAFTYTVAPIVIEGWDEDEAVA